ncbi:hypothetical protein F4677DRAFT_422187 [Hypoxylon crocopeplum]|nr:hypothetical protein F4677DRAFT_422187 [Hypoxylon crocopeplum]
MSSPSASKRRRTNNERKRQRDDDEFGNTIAGYDSDRSDDSRDQDRVPRPIYKPGPPIPYEEWTEEENAEWDRKVKDFEMQTAGGRLHPDLVRIRAEQDARDEARREASEDGEEEDDDDDDDDEQLEDDESPLALRAEGGREDKWVLSSHDAESLLRITGATINFMINARGAAGEDVELDLSDASAVRALLEAGGREVVENSVDWQTTSEDAAKRAEAVAERLLDMKVRDFLGLADLVLDFSRDLSEKGITLWGMPPY